MPANFRFPFALVPIAQLASAVLALTVGGFLFQSGSAGLGALAILWLRGGKGFRRADLWMAIAAFAFSIVGDYFLSNRGGDPLMFVYGIGFFFVAHLGYLGYALCHGRLDLKVTALFCTGYLIFFFTSLYGGISDPVLMWAALAYLFNNTRTDEECSEWGEVSELKYLFRGPQKWTRAQAHAFISAAWDYLGLE